MSKPGDKWLAVHPGAAYHIESLEAPRYAGHFDALVRPEDLASARLEDYGLVLVPCRTPADRMIPMAPLLAEYLNRGGTVVATGESHSQLWLPKINFVEQPTNYWWWKDPDATLGLRIADNNHSLFRYTSLRDAVWHLHGSFAPPKGAQILIADADGRAILYIDKVTTGGTMVITSLDPFYHHGSHFMSATTRFLDGFLKWLKETPL